MKKCLFFLLLKTARNTILRRAPFYWGLIQIKWCLRALIGLQARPITINQLGRSLVRYSEGVCPIETKQLSRNEKLSLPFRIARKLKISGTEKPIHLNMGK